MAHPNATAASMLGFLHHGPMTGWDLAATAEVVIGPFWSLTRSQVYRELARLEADGLVEGGEVGPRDRRPFTITTAGREAFADWVAQPPAEETIRFPLLLTVALGRHVPREDLDAHLAHHRRIHAERLDGYLRARAAAEAVPDADPWSQATLDFGIRYERAALGWFDGLDEILPR